MQKDISREIVGTEADVSVNTFIGEMDKGDERPPEISVRVLDVTIADVDWRVRALLRRTSSIEKAEKESYIFCE